MSNKSIKAIFFDIGNVLFYFDLNISIEKISKRLGIKPGQILPVMREATDLFEKGIINKDQYYGAFTENFGNDIAMDEFYDIFNDIFTPNYHLLDLLPELSESYKLVIVSNTNEMHISHLTAKFGSYFDHFKIKVYSHEIGCKKPDHIFFEKAVSLSGVKYSEVIYFDDLPENINSAEILGIKGKLYNKGLDIEEALLLSVRGEEQ